jgi:hypothetical protein
MGMFDNLICKYPLPRPEMQTCEFQTKDLECVLDSYEITEDGRLVRHEWDYEWQDDPSSPLKGWLRRKDESYRAVHLDYTGHIRFYDFWPPREVNPNSPLIEFTVSMKNGFVEWIREEKPDSGKHNS